MINKLRIETDRPLFVFSFSVFACSAAISGWQGKYKLLLLIVSSIMLSLFVFSTLLKRRKSNNHEADRSGANQRVAPARNILILALCAGIVSSFSSYIINIRMESANKYDGEQTYLSATIIKAEYSSSYYGYVTARAEFPDGKTRTVFLGAPDGSFSRGDVMECVAKLRSVEKEDTSRISDGIFLIGECETAVRIGTDDRFSPISFFAGVNEKLTAKLYSSAEEDAASLSSAVLLGNRSGLNLSARRDFTRLGVSHLLAISGLHLSALTAMLEAVLIKAGAKRRLRGAVLIPSVVIFMGITGFSPSVLRAGFMHIIRIFGTLIGRKSDPWTSLGVAAALIVLVNPCSAFDVRLLLSVASAFACVSFASMSSRRIRSRSPIRRAAYTAIDTLKLTVYITAFTIPISWGKFGSLPILSPLSNLIFIPLMTAYMYLSVLLIILFPFPHLFGATSRAAAAFARLIFGISSRLAAPGWVTVSLRYEAAGIFAWILFVCVFITVFLKRKRFGYLFSAVSAVCLAICIAVGMIFQSGTSEIVFLNKNKNDGFIIRDGHRYTAIDVSSGSSSFLYDLLREADSSNAVEIETLALTHYHSGHTGSVGDAIKRWKVRKILMPVPENEKDMSVADSLLLSCSKEGVETIFYKRDNGSVAVDGNVKLHFYDYTMLSRSTHPLICFSAEIGEERFTYLGSSFFEAGEVAAADAETAGIVFFGAHPPKNKKGGSMIVQGDAVFTNIAYEFWSEFSAISGGDSIVLPSGGGVYRKES